MLLAVFTSSYSYGQNFKVDEIKQSELLLIFNKDSSVVRMKSKTNKKYFNGLKRIIHNDSIYSTLRIKNGFPDGEWIMVSNEGRYKFIGNYKEGKKHGTHTHFYADGSRRLVENHIDGYQEGKTLMFYPNGKLGGEFFCKKGKKHGVEKWYDFGKRVIKKEYYLNGTKVDSINFKKRYN